MKAFLSLLAGLTTCIIAENCDPIAYEQSNPYGLSETKDPEVMKKLNKYLEDMAAIRSAKAYKYAHEAQDAAQEWADFFLSGADFAGQAGCSPLVPSRDDLIKKAFTPLSSTGRNDCSVQDFFNLRNVFSYRVYDLLADIFHNSACHVNNAYLAALDKDEVVDEASLLSRSYPIDLRYAGLEKRAKPKEGSACDYPLESFRYPSSGEWEADKPKKHGFNKRDSCDDYSMDKPDEGAGIQYDTEHVLEWQTVVQFFNTMGKEIMTKFKNPDPQQNNMVGFSSVYPWKQDGDQMWLDEMPLLESGINARYKGRLFIQTLKKSGENEDIVAEKKMKALIKGRDKKLKLSVSDQSRRAIQKMRPMIGALKYMQQDSIAEIFANQKNRIGAMIGYIDRELQKTPRRFADATKPKSQEYVIDALPWQEQGLEKKWDAYMDNVFAVAKQRATDFMTVNLDRLKDEWESSKKTEVPKNFKGDAQAKQNEKKKLEQTQKDMLALIKKTQDEWDKVKDWAMPWKSKDEKEMDDDGADQ
ncbi:hypothetical protein J4E83_009676 [Alternaria metachromatica]|uniref:uncharacterized protein n=1 Tax=Alternaria metachromatica TaxID=283354 RepID=UPI0020C57459|nr:uncharacterized protein J4E83_009676 [Alternaria metachromatica]KAI4607220.1 hypothetical protein J4E83_009676 [Alternaria metachromatica]